MVDKPYVSVFVADSAGSSLNLRSIFPLYELAAIEEAQNLKSWAGMW